MLLDAYQRRIEYLRLSVTEQCNLRCHYCMPLTAGGRVEGASILNFDEIERLVRIMVGLGIRRVRLTGGEPLARKELPSLVRRLTSIQGLEEVLLTTNALLLAQNAEALKAAGLRRINIHLDTLDPQTFKKITRWGNIERVFEGIREAKRVGFEPIKINAVIQRGLNDHEVKELLLFAVKEGLYLRFIELMPIGPARAMPSLFMPMDEVRSLLEKKYSLVPMIGQSPGAGPAVYYRVAELNAMVGFISPLSQPFCQRCDRIRVSSDGRFQDCLAYDGTFSLRDLLRNPDLTDDAVAREIHGLMTKKRGGHEGFVQGNSERTPCMYGIGG